MKCTRVITRATGAGLGNARADLVRTFRKAPDPGLCAFFACLVLAVTSCTYGPVEEDARITHLIRPGDSYRAVVMVQQEVL